MWTKPIFRPQGNNNLPICFLFYEKLIDWLIDCLAQYCPIGPSAGKKSIDGRFSVLDAVLERNSTSGASETRSSPDWVHGGNAVAADVFALRRQCRLRGPLLLKLLVRPSQFFLGYRIPQEGGKYWNAIRRWVDEETVVDVSNETPLSHREEGNPPFYNVDGTWYHTQWNKPDREKETLYALTYTRTLTGPTLRNGQWSGGCRGRGLGGMGRCQPKCTRSWLRDAYALGISRTAWPLQFSNALLCTWDFPAGKASTCQRRGRRFDPCVGKVSWRRKWQPTPVFLPGKSHGRRSLAGCRLQGRKRCGHCLVIKQQEQTGYLKVKSGFCKTCCWSIAALRCAVRFCCRAKWISCTYASFPSALDFLPVWVTEALSIIHCAVYRFSSIIYFIHRVKSVHEPIPAPSSPYPLFPLSVCLFSSSLSLFLFCKWDHLYHFFHIPLKCINIWYLFSLSDLLTCMIDSKSILVSTKDPVLFLFMVE